MEEVDGRGMANVGGSDRPGNDDRRTLIVDGAMLTGEKAKLMVLRVLVYLIQIRL